MTPVYVLSKYVLGLTQAEHDSLEKLIDYSERDERKDYEQNDCPQCHIYPHIQRLDNALTRASGEKPDYCLHGRPVSQWASAIAERVSDEWHGKGEFPETSAILRDVLCRLLTDNPDECDKFIGTGIIEATYFDKEV